METTKLCPKHDNGAGAVLPASAFYIIKNRQGKAALAGYCKECSKEIAKAYHRAHPDQARAAVRASLERHPETKRKHYPSQDEWRRRDTKAHPDKYLNRHQKHNFRKKGLSLEWYNAKLAEQGGHCALCPAEVCTSGRLLCIDHNHVTTELRGLLCDRCNSCLERLEEIPDWAELAYAYLTHYATVSDLPRLPAKATA